MSTIFILTAIGCTIALISGEFGVFNDESNISQDSLISAPATNISESTQHSLQEVTKMIPQRSQVLRKLSAISILFVSIVVGHIFELKSCKLSDIFNNGFELRYELQCDTLSSPANETIDVIPHSIAQPFNFTPAGVGIQTRKIVNSSTTSVAATQGIINENEMKIGGSPPWEQVPIQSQTASHSTAPTNDMLFIFDPIGAETPVFNDLKCVYAVLSNVSDGNLCASAGM